MSRRSTLVLVVLAPLATTMLVVAPAHADPAGTPGALPLTVTCDNGAVYDVISNGNGNWTPAHDLASTSTLVPVAFGESTFTITDSSGNVLDSETMPASTKGQSGNQVRGTTISCSYTGGGADPESGMVFTLSGTVEGFTTPAR
jgi:hypothetical protein